MILYIILAIIIVILIWAIFAYNKFIKTRNHAREAWSDIDVQLRRRYDLIPNLVNVVKNYAKHEQETFTKVTNARNMAIDANSVEDQAAAENMLSGALKSLFAVSEAYPDLKANTNFIELQKELTDTENKIKASRRFYNSVVMALNTTIESFPQNMIANMFNFKKREFFEIEEGEEIAREPVKVDLDK